MAPFETVAPEVLTVCTYTRFAPFSHEQAGQIVGTDISLLTHFAASHGLTMRVNATEFPDIWQRPGRGECDIAAAGIAALAERDPGARGCWSDAYTIVRRSLLIRKSDVDSLRSPADFADRVIVVTASSTADVDARTRYADRGADVRAALPPQDEMVRRLLDGEIDAYAGGETSNRFLVESEPRLAVVDVHPMDPPETLHFAVRHADPRLVETLNLFIASLADSDESLSN